MKPIRDVRRLEPPLHDRGPRKSICTSALPQRTSKEIPDAALAWDTEGKDSLRPAGASRPSNTGGLRRQVGLSHSRYSGAPRDGESIFAAQCFAAWYNSQVKKPRQLTIMDHLLDWPRRTILAVKRYRMATYILRRQLNRPAGRNRTLMIVVKHAAWTSRRCFANFERTSCNDRGASRPPASDAWPTMCARDSMDQLLYFKNSHARKQKAAAGRIM